MTRRLCPCAAIGAAVLAWSAAAPATPARAASPASPAVIASAAAAQGNDFWEDRFTAMRKIWGTPYVPLGYYWDQVRGLPPRPAPVAPGIYADRPVYPLGSLGYGPGYGYGPGLGYGYGPPGGYGYSYGYGYRQPIGWAGYGSGLGLSIGFGFGPGFGYGAYPAYGSPYGSFYGW